MRLTGASHTPRGGHAPTTDESDAAQALAVVILPFSRKELARAAKRSPDAAKEWKEGRNLPSAWSMLNMARGIPAVRDWVVSQIGAETPTNSPQGLNALVEVVLALANMPGPDGDAVRAILSRGGR